MIYTRQTVELLVPSIWDRTFAFGITDPSAPPAGMPRGSIDKSHGNTLWVHLADIRSAWKGAALSHGERVALLCWYGLGWTQEQIAAHEGVSHQAISGRIATGVGRLAAYLNRQSYDIDEDEVDVD